MFQLIVAVISIALVAALAIASIYYGGQAFQKSGVKAAADTLVNGGQQISGAYALYNTDFGVPPASLSALEPSYLTAAPALPSGVTGTWAFSTDGTAAQVTGASAGVCAAVNDLSGAGSSTFSCTGGTFSFTL